MNLYFRHTSLAAEEKDSPPKQITSLFNYVKFWCLCQEVAGKGQWHDRTPGRSASSQLLSNSPTTIIKQIVCPLPEKASSAQEMASQSCLYWCGECIFPLNKNTQSQWEKHSERKKYTLALFLKYHSQERRFPNQGNSEKSDILLWSFWHLQLMSCLYL